ncbi:MAG: Sortase and related acyltransferase [Acidimicrobiales bacterium]|nr:Sortase and related acyltransferase [Acidimicrobiales bacterium]
MPRPIDLMTGTATEPGLFELFAGIVERGEGFPQLPPLRTEEYAAMWGAATAVVIARMDGILAGASYLKPNGPGLGAHIANAGYIVSPEHRGIGVGRRLVEDSIRRAPALGFDAIQFNFVFERNPALGLYLELGWVVIGRIPRALVDQDALILWRATPGESGDAPPPPTRG